MFINKPRFGQKANRFLIYLYNEYKFITYLLTFVFKCCNFGKQFGR